MSLSYRALPIVAALLAVLPGCGPSRAADSAVPAATADPGAAASVAPAPSASAPEPAIAAGSTVSLPQLITVALRHNPTQAVFAANRRAAAAQLLQAGAWDNPELELELGSAKTTEGDRLGVGRVSLRQRLPWPGKRSTRIDAAAAGQTVAETESRSLALEIAGEVSSTGIDLAIDDQALEQAKAIQTLARDVANLVDKRLAAGEATRADVLRARVDALQADQIVATSASDVAAARASLNALCGGVLPDSFTIAIPLDQLPAIDRDQALLAADRQHPELARLQALTRQHRLEVDREHRAAYPDVTVGVFGGKETDSRGLGVSLGIDVPLWNRNQGGVEAALAEVDRTQAELAVERAKLRREVDQAWREYEKTRAVVARYRSDIRTTAQEALRLALSAYQAGETSALAVLDARRTAQDIETTYLDALRQAHAARIRLDLATGALAPGVPTTSGPAAGATP